MSLTQTRQNTDLRYLPEFSEWLSQQHASQKTIKNYVSDVRRFLAWLEERFPGMNLTNVQADAADRYLEELALTGTSPNTIQRKRASLRRFGDFWAATYSVTTPVQIRPSAAVQVDNPRTNPVAAWDTLLRRFALALEAEDCKDSTVKNYTIDVGLFAEAHQNLPPYEILTKTRIDAYQRQLRFEGLSNATLSRKSASLRRFADWALKEELIEANPFAGRLEAAKESAEKSVVSVKEAVKTRFAPLALFENKNKTTPGKSDLPAKDLEKIEPSRASRGGFSRLYQAYSATRISSYIHLAILVIFSVAIGLLAYQQFGPQAADPFAYPSDLTRPGRILSFQGRVTDTSGTPISSAINMEFRLYNDSTVGTQLWDSATCSIDPDQDGVFSTLLGDTCGTEIDQNVFSENSEVWLEVQVGSETLTPRQRIASVAYALNAETLQGFPPSLGGEINTIPVINALGQVIIGANNPSLIASSGAFLIQAESMTFQTEAGSAGDITFAPDAGGTVNILSGTTSQDSLYIANANLTSGNLIHGYVGNDSGTGNLLYLGGGSSETTRLAVSKMGDLFVGRAATISGSLAVDTNTLFVDNVNNRVGIGTSAPSVPLEVNGQIKLTGTYLSNSTNLTLSSGGANPTISSGGNNSLVITNTHGGLLVTDSDNGNAVAFDVSRHGNRSYFSTTLGVGDSTPDAQFTVGSSSQFQVNSSGNIISLGGAAHSIANASNDLVLTAVDDLMFNDVRTGNIPLSVADTAIDSALSQGIIDAINDVYGLATGTGGGLWEISSGAYVQKNTTADVLIGGTASSSANILLGATGAAVFNEQGNDVDFRVESDTDANALFVDGNTGYVGVGTGTPVQKFQVTGTYGLPATSGTTQNGIARIKGSGQYVMDMGVASGIGGWIQSTSDLNLGSSNSLLLNPNGGRVGIGTTDPQYTLDVSAGSSNSVTMRLHGVNSSLSLHDTNGTNFNLNTGANGGGNGKFTIYDETNSASRFVIDATGNVGIGTTSPGAKLQVNGVIRGNNGSNDIVLQDGAGNQAFRGVRASTGWSDAVNAQWFQVGNSTDNIVFAAQSGTTANRMGFLTNAFHITTTYGTSAPVGIFDVSNGNTKLFNILSSGNVGIGTTNPTSLFSVGATSQFQVNSSGEIVAIDGVAHTLTDSSGNLAINSNGTAVVVVDDLQVNGGDIGIAADTDLLQLASSVFTINGTTQANGNITTTGTITLPNSNTLTGVANYTQFSGGVSVGGSTTYGIANTGSANLNAITAAGTINANGGLITRAGGNLSITTTTSGNITLDSVGNLYFNDVRTGNIPLTVADTAIDANLTQGVIDAINDVYDVAKNNTGLWATTNGALYPKNSTLDLLIGATATSSAQFAVNATNGNVRINQGNLTLGYVGGVATIGTNGDFVFQLDADNNGNNALTVRNSSGNDVVTISETEFISHVPSSFLSPGDVSFAYDILLTNNTASAIRSNAPLTIEAGESFESNDLTLKTYNAGDVVFDAGGGVTLAQAQDWTLASSTTALNLASGLLNLDTTNNRVGVGTAAPTQKLHVEGGGIRLGTTSNTNNVLDTAAQAGAPSGNLYWGNRQIIDSTNIGSFGVASVTGTANQITATPTTGNVVLSLPTDLRAPGTFNATTSIATGAGAGTTRIDASGNLTNIGNITTSGTTGISMSGAGAGLTFSGTGNHVISASGGVLQIGAHTLTGAITGNGNAITGLSQLTVDNLRLDGNTIDTTSGNLTLDSTGGTVAINDNITTTGTITLPNTNTMTGVANYVQFNNGISVGGGTTYYINSSGNAVVNNLNVNGTTTLGDAGADTVTVNANAWTFANDTNFALTGGVNGLSFDTNTLSIDATNDRIGIGNIAPTQKLDVSGNVLATDFLVAGNTVETGNVAAVQRRFKKTVNADTIQELGNWTDAEGTVELMVTVSSETGSHSGTNTYYVQGGWNQFGTSWSELLPFVQGRGHGDSTAGFKLMVRRDAGGTYSLGVAVPTGLANKTLQVTVSEMKGGMTFVDNSSASAVAYASAATYYSNRTILAEGIGIGTTAPSQALDVTGAIRLGAAGANNVLNTTVAGGAPTGNLYWGNRTLIDSSNISSFGVSSVTGTANQITASPTTGAVVLSLPTDLRAPGTFNAVTSIATGAGAGTTRIDASGNLSNIGTITASGAITTSATGNALTLSGAATNAINISGAATTGINLSNAGITTDISLQNNETIDNNTDGTINLGTTTLALTGTTTLTATSLASMNTASAVSWNGATTLTFAADNATINGSDVANGNLILQGTSDSTRTTSYLQLQPNGGNVGIGTTAPATTLDVNGETTFRGDVTLANGTNSRLTGNSNTINLGTGSGLTFTTYASGTTLTFNAGNQRSVVFSGSHTSTSGSRNQINVTTDFSPTSGTAVLNMFALNTVVNQTGGANGITRGIYINPTLTAAADWRSLEITNNTGYGIYQSGTAPNTFAGNVGIGTTNPSQALHVEGAIRLGATSNANNVLNTAAAGGAPSGSLYWGNREIIDSTSIGSYGVTSVTGTANQITSSPTTGAVVLSLPTDLRAPGTFNATTSIATGAGAGTVRIAANGNLTNIGTIASTYLTTTTNTVNVAGASTVFQMNGTTIVDASRNLTNIANATINGNTTLGDAAGDTVTVNSAAWTFANDTNFALTGGVNGLSFDTDTLSIDAANDRVGIGTTNPAAKLQVDVDLSTTKGISIHNTNASFGSNPFEVTNISGTPTFYLSSANNVVSTNGGFSFGNSSPNFASYQGYVKTQNAGRVGLYVAATTGQTADIFQVANNSGIKFNVDANGNVGIGTTAPSQILDVTGAIRLGAAGTNNVLNTAAAGGAPSGILYWGNRELIDSSNIGTYGVTSVTGTANQITASPTVGNVVLSLPADLRAPGTFNAVTSVATGAGAGTTRIDASGNLSNIGTIASTYLTTTTNTVNVAGASTVFQMNGTTIVDASRNLTNIANATINGNTILGDAAGDTVTANAAAWTFANDTNFALTGGVNGLSFDTTTLSIDATNDRVGIGTAAPGAKLQVDSASGGVNDFISIKRGSTDWRIWASDSETTTPSLRIGGTAVGAYAWQFDWSGVTANIFKSPNNVAAQNVLEIRGAASQSGKYFAVTSSGGSLGNIFNVGSNGNVGIGTTAPVSLLDVSSVTGSATITPTTISISSRTAASDWSTTASWGNLDFYSSDPSGPSVRARIGAIFEHATGGNTGLAFSTSDATTLSEAMRIDKDGNVGIGITAPTAKLQVLVPGATVAGPTGTWAARIDNMVDTTTYNGLNVSIRNALQSSKVFEAGVYWNGSETYTPKFTITGAGRVGIGTTDPMHALDVQGKINVSDGVIQRGGSAVSSTSDLGLYSQVGSGWMRFVTNSGPFHWYSDSGGGTTPIMTLTSGGDLGVGTSSPTSRFSVGSSSQFQVNSSGNIVSIGGVAHSIANSSGSLQITSAADLLLDDSHLSSAVKLANTATSLTAPGGGIIDAINGTYTIVSGLTNYWDRNTGTGVLFPVTLTDDVLFGGNSVGTAKFRIDQDDGSLYIGALQHIIESASVLDYTSTPQDVLKISPNADYLQIASDIIVSGGDIYGPYVSQLAQSPSISLLSNSDVAVHGKLGVGVTVAEMQIHAKVTTNGGGLLTKYGSTNAGDYVGNYFGIDTASGYNKGAVLFERKDTYGRGNLHWALDNTADSSNVTLADSLMTLTTAGNVGIGTTAPNFKLNVRGATNALGLFESTGSNAASVWLNNVAGGQSTYVSLVDAGTEKFQIGKDGSNNFFLYDTAQTRNFLSTTSAGNLLLQQSGGNVGIGTTAPGVKLEVYDSGSIKTTILGRGQDQDFNIYTRQDKTANGTGALIGELGLEYGTTQNAAIRFHRGASTTGGYISLTAGAGTEEVKIDENSATFYGDVVFSPKSTGSTTTEGAVYYDSDIDHLMLRAGDAAWHRLAKDMTIYSSSGTIQNGDYLEVAHNQNTLDVVATAWVSAIGGWTEIDGLYSVVSNWGTGTDGDLTPSGAFNMNTNTSNGRSYADGIAYRVNAATATGNSVDRYDANSNFTNGFAAGDEVLLISLQGASGDTTDVGNYEYKRVSSVTASTMTFTENIANSYDGTTAANQKVVVQRVPNYARVILDSTDSITTGDWDALATVPTGAAGYYTGIVAYRALLTSIASGTSINVAQKGFVGANGATHAESTDGKLARGGGGGGTGTGSNTGAGGAGGGAGSGGSGAGGAGGSGYCNGKGGGGGGGGGGSHTVPANSSSTSKLYLGSGATQGAAGGAAGGGGGGDMSCSGNPGGSTGGGGGGAKNNSGTAGDGGGIVLINSKFFTNSGSISAIGGNGTAGSGGANASNTCCAGGAGGGGGGGRGGSGAAGGTVYIRAGASIAGITVAGGAAGAGGAGGARAENQTWDGLGGGQYSVAGSAGGSGAAGGTGFSNVTVAGDVEVTDFSLVLNNNSARLYNLNGFAITLKLTIIVKGADLAEWYPTQDNSIESGDVVALDRNMPTSGNYSAPGIAKANGEYDEGALGVISEKAGIELSVGGPGRRLVGLQGRVPIKVSSINGPIRKGDYLTASSIPGVAMRATRPGKVVAQAMTDYDSSDPTDVGKVIGFLGVGYQNPGLNINPEEQTVLAFSPDGALFNSTQLSALASLDPQELALPENEATQSAVLAELNTLSSSAWNSVSAAVINAYQTIAAPTARIGELITSVIRPGSSGSVTIDLGPFSASNSAQLRIMGGADGQETVASIDNAGNASFSGILRAQQVITNDMNTRYLTAQDLAVVNATVSGELTAESLFANSARVNSLEASILAAANATISGTLYADRIEGRLNSTQISDLQERVFALIAQERAQNPGSSVEDLITDDFEEETGLGDLLDEQNDQIASGSGVFLAQGADVELGSVSAVNLNLESTLSVGQNLMFTANTLAFNVDETCGLDTGSEDETGVDPTCNTFFFQPSGQGRLSFLADAMVLSRDGGLVINTDVFVNGRLTASGGVSTSLLAALPGENIEINLAGAPTEAEMLEEFGSGATNVPTIPGSDLIIRGDNGKEVAAFTASGSARLQRLTLVAEAATADSQAIDTSIQTNATTGTATIGAGSTEFLIRNSNITDHSLIYVTPTSDTRNQVVFVKAKISDYLGTPEINEAGFIVSVSQPILDDIDFNWWIVEGVAQAN